MVTVDVRAETRDPLAPIEFAVTLVSVLLALLFVVTIPVALFGSGSVLGLGDPDACVTVRSGVVPYSGDAAAGGVVGLHRDASSWPERLRICTNHPSALVKSASVTGSAVSLLLLAGFLVLTRRLIRSARQDRLFTTAVASRTVTLGWFLLAGSVAGAVVSAAARGVVVSSAVDDLSWAQASHDVDMPWTLVMVGIGVLTVARVLRDATALQEDVDATI